MAQRTTAELMQDLARSGVTLTLIDGQIHYSGPAGRFAAEELREVRSRRAEVVSYLECSKPAVKTVLPIGSYARPLKTPLSSSQRFWWELEQITGPQRHPMMPIAVAADVDESILRGAFTAVVSSHEALRTRFIVDDGRVFTVIDPPTDVELDLADFSSLPEDEAQAAASAFITQYHFTRYELNGGSLFRACLVKISSKHRVALVGAHHSIMDASSLSVLGADLSAAYAALASGATWQPGARVQLADFCIWEQHWLRSSGCDDPYEYWSARLEGAAPLQLPTDRPRTGQRSGFFEGRCELNLPERVVAGLRALGQRCGTTTQVNILAVYGLVLAQWSMCTDVLFGNYTMFRWPVGTADLIGCLAQNRPILLQIRKRASFTDYLEHVRAAYAVSLDFQKVVGAEIAWRRHLNRIIANLAILSEEQATSDGAPPPSPLLPVNHELALMLQEGPSSVRGFVSYAADLFRPGTIQRFCSEIERVAAAVSRDPTQRLIQLIPALMSLRSTGEA